MLEDLLKTYDNPVKISEWFNKPFPNRGLPSVLAEADTSGNIQAYYVYGLGLISKIEGSNAYFYQYDGLGSTVAITDRNGAVKNKYAYDDFGNLATNCTESIANPFKYVGRFGVMTDASDLLYMRARYYSPSLGRFLNKDPIGLAGGFNMYRYVDSVGKPIAGTDINLYEYAHNNPVNWIDPKGEYAIWIIGTAVVVLTTYAIELIAYSFGNYPPSCLRGGATVTNLMYEITQYNKNKVFVIDSWAGWPKR